MRYNTIGGTATLKSFTKRRAFFPRNWEGSTNGRCWNKLEPALIEIGDYAFMLVQTLHLEKGFELSINSSRDWYDKTWR